MSLLLLVGGLLTVAPSQAQTAQPITKIENAAGDSVFVSYEDGGFTAFGEFGTGAIPAEGVGTRLMWYPAKGAFRAGYVSGSQWDDANIGDYSVAFGENTVASGTASTALGNSTSASGLAATAMGFNTSASGSYSAAIGFNTTASGDLSMAFGLDAEATGYASTAMGRNTTASGRYSVAMGYISKAIRDYSFALGSQARAKHEGAFVWSGLQDDAFLSTGPNQFLISAVGGVGIGTNAPATQLHVADNVAGASAGVHVALIENTSTSTNADGLVIRLSNVNLPGAANNFVSFIGGIDGAGQIQGNGSGGVQYVSSGGDFAELLPRLDPAESIEVGDVVGVFGGKITKKTAGAGQVMVVTDRAVVLGNAVPESERARYEAVSFIGQVPVRVRGPVAVGDLLVASGRGDGTARAVERSTYDPSTHGPVIGRAWASSPGGVRRVNAVIGVDQPAALRAVVERQQAQIEALQAEVEALRARPVPPALALPMAGVLLLGGLIVGGVVFVCRRRS